MKPSLFLLPPEIEKHVGRLTIGAGQPEYEQIPAVKVADPSGATCLLSRWEFDDDEKDAIARSRFRGILWALVTWVAKNEKRMPRSDDDFVALVNEFIEAHPDTFDGPDAYLWYGRLIFGRPGETVSYQPQRMEIAPLPPLDLEVTQTPGIILPDGPRQVQ